jgi:NH3-dependent NAD+ synthetase
MILHMHLAQLFGGVYLDTDDLSEWLMGFWTRHGDEGDIKTLQQLTKDEVYDLGAFMGIPASILNAPPGDGLKVTATSAATDQLGMNYMRCDYVMSRFVFAGFDLNGHKSQLNKRQVRKLIAEIAIEIDQPAEKVTGVIRQALNTAFKRKYGESVIELLPDREELGLPKFATAEFNARYLRAIKKS